MSTRGRRGQTLVRRRLLRAEDQRRAWEGRRGGRTRRIRLDEIPQVGVGHLSPRFLPEEEVLVEGGRRGARE